MSRIWKACLMALAAAGLLVAGCEKKSGDESEGQGQKAQAAEAEKAEESSDDQADQQAEEAEQADFSQEDYVKAAAGLSCIDSKLGDDQIEDRDTVEQNVLGKYGFDQDSYAKAEEQFADNEQVKSSIDSQLEDCDEKRARKLAGLEQTGGESESGDDEKNQPKAKPKPAYVGSLSGEKTDAAGFKRAKLTVTVSEDFSANGNFSGAREKGFRIPLKGKVTKDNKLKLSGSAGGGKNEVEVQGTLKEGGTTAEVSGTMWEKKFSTTVKLN